MKPPEVSKKIQIPLIGTGNRVVCTISIYPKAHSVTGLPEGIILTWPSIAFSTIIHFLKKIGMAGTTILM